MDFRCRVSPQVTASDASQEGGGITASTGLTPAGTVCAQCKIRGDIVEPADITQVLTIGVFDGIGALRVACDALGWNIQGHISIEKSKEAARVVESRFPNTIFVEDVQLVDDWSQQFTQVGLILVGGGPPCQGVSGLNASRKGALRYSRRSLFVHVRRICKLVAHHFPWAQVRGPMENQADEKVMSESFGQDPWYIDAGHVSLARRPRLYWIDWELQECKHVKFGHTDAGRACVTLHAQLDPHDYLKPGWALNSSKKLPTFTTSRPRDQPGYKPAGLKSCKEHEVSRWSSDWHRFPPYQYQDDACLVNKHGDLRLPNIQEREVIMGFPKNYTFNCVPKKDQKKFTRMTPDSP